MKRIWIGGSLLLLLFGLIAPVLAQEAGFRPAETSPTGRAFPGPLLGHQPDPPFRNPIYPSAGVTVTPDLSLQEGCPHDAVLHTFTIRNYTGRTETFDITCSGYTWPTDCPLTVGPIPDHDSAPFEVSVTVPGDACRGAIDMVNIRVQAQSSPYSDTVVAETRVLTLTTPVWEDRALSYGTPTDSALVYWDAGAGPRVYQIGGYGNGGAVGIYNPADNSWTAGPTEPSPAIAYTVDGCLGRNASGQDVIAIFNDTYSGATVWHIYNIDTNSWTTAAVPSGFPANGLWATDIASGLPHGANVCYISGGATVPGGGNTSALYRYNPAAHTILNLGNFSLHPAGFDFHSSWYIPASVLPGLPGGGVCVAGGVDSGYVVFADTQCYNFATNSFNTPNADLGQLPVAHWGGADFTLDPPGPDFQLWIVNGMDAGFNLWPHSMYYSALDGAWHYGPDPTQAAYRIEGDAYLNDAYVLSGSYLMHLRQPCDLGLGIIHGYVMDAQEGCTQATCTPARVHLEPSGVNIPVDATGYYTASVPACTYEATASAPGYQDDGPYTVPVTTTAPVQQDFCLNRPDIEVNPTALEASGYYSLPVTDTLVITNAGYPTLTWEIGEIPSGLAAEGELVVRPAYYGVDSYIEEEFAASTDGKADVFLAFAGEVDLSPATRIRNWEARGRWVVDTLQALADRSQANVRRWLESQGMEYRVNLNNTIFARLTRAQLEAALKFPEVVGALGNRVYTVDPLIDPNAPVPNATVDWGLLKVRAPETWADFGARGQGIVVAGISTGVQWDHPALDQAYLCPGNPTDSRCWYDPSNTCGGTVCDNVGLGTHTMGTMVGDDDPALTYIAGMAPDARWIACKGCESASCSTFALTACANWLLQPGGNPANRPHVVNNPWGGGSNPWYRSYVQAWRAAGIFPAFPVGGSGPSCETVGSPADYPESFASGATNTNDVIATFSARGPSSWDEIKPEVTAPGVNICSSVPGSSWSCYSGTSPANSHTAGLVAMLWSCNPTLVGNIAATERLITSTAVCIQDLSCGGTACPDGANNVYGWGRIDAYAAAQAGCLLDIPWMWESPITGTTPPGETSPVDVTFHCPVTDVVDLTGTLRIVSNDPCASPLDIPVTLHCLGPCEPLTSADFTWAPPEPPAGTSVLFTASYAPPTASQPINFSWAFGDHTYGSGITATHTYAAPGNYVVVLTATNPCSLLVVTHTVPVTLPLVPDIEVSPTSLSAEQCPDTVTTQTLSICNEGTAPLVWSLSEVSGVVGLAAPRPPAPAGGPSPSLDIPWLEESPTGGAQDPGVCVLVTVRFDSSGLSPITYTAGLLVESNDPDEPQTGIPVTLTVIAPAGDADFAWSPVTPTVGELVHFTGTVASGAPPLTYTWAWGDGHTEVLTEPTALHTYTATGVYTVRMTATNACGAATAAHDLVVVEGCVGPAGADFAWMPVTPTVGQAAAFTATYTPPTATQPLTYTWDWGDGHTEVLTEPTAFHTYTATGVYTVRMTATNACGTATAAHDLWVRPALPPSHIIYLPLVFRGYAAP